MKIPLTQEERLTRYVIIAVLIIIMMLCGAIAYLVTDYSITKDDYVNTKDRVFSLENFAKNINTQDGVDGRQGIQGVQGIQGIQGVKGDKGDTGSQGVDGVSPVSIPGERGEKGDTGERGEKGEPGLNGKTIFTRTNLLTGEGECRYAGDTEWQPETECE